MSEPFSHLVATLSKAQSTMSPHLVRLSRAPHPEKVRLLLLQREAGHFKGAAEALLRRLMQQEAALDLILQTKELVALFRDAEKQAAALLRNESQAGPDMADERDAVDPNAAGDHPETDESTRPVRVGSGWVSLAQTSQGRGGRSSAYLAARLKTRGLALRLGP